MITETLTTHLKKNETFVSGSGSVDATPRYLGALADPDGATRGGVVVWKRWRMDGPTREHSLNPLLGLYVEDAGKVLVEMNEADGDGALRGRTRLPDGRSATVTLHPLKRDDRLRSGGRNTVTVELGAERYDPFAEETTRRPLPVEYFFPYDD